MVRRENIPKAGYYSLMNHRINYTYANRVLFFIDGGAPMETPDLSTLSDNIDSTDDLVPSLQVPIRNGQPSSISVWKIFHFNFFLFCLFFSGKFVTS